MNEDQNTKKNGPYGAVWRQHLLARLAAERVHLFLQFRSLNVEKLTTIPASGDLSVKDLLLHVAAWDAFHTEKISLVRHDRNKELQDLTPETLNQRNVQHINKYRGIYDTATAKR